MKLITYYTPSKNDNDVSTRQHKAKTPKICACCYKKIEVDSVYIKRVGIHNRKFFSTPFHPACYRYYRRSLMALCNPYQAIKAC